MKTAPKIVCLDSSRVTLALLRLLEGVFSLIRRGVMGTFHSISRKHLPNYLNEFEFRRNTRKLDDGQRVSAAIKKIDGKRLEYLESVEKPAIPSGAQRTNERTI